MPSRKRTNWRHPVIYDDNGTAGRRTTRAAAIGQKRLSSDGNTSSGVSPYTQNGHYGGAGNSSSGNNHVVRRERDGTIINVSISRNKRAKNWIEVHRPPAAGIRFTVPMWVPVDDLTVQERDLYLPTPPDTKETEEGDNAFEGDENEESIKESSGGLKSENTVCNDPSLTNEETPSKNMSDNKQQQTSDFYGKQTLYSTPDETEMTAGALAGLVSLSDPNKASKPTSSLLVGLENSLKTTAGSIASNSNLE